VPAANVVDRILKPDAQTSPTDVAGRRAAGEWCFGHRESTVPAALDYRNGINGRGCWLERCAKQRDYIGNATSKEVTFRVQNITIS